MKMSIWLCWLAMMSMPLYQPTDLKMVPIECIEIHCNIRIFFFYIWFETYLFVENKPFDFHPTLSWFKSHNPF